MKKNFKNTLNEMKYIAKATPKSIKEAMDYDERDMMGGYEGEIPDEDEESVEEPHDDGGMDVRAFIDDIRKQSLKGMAQLADDPMSEEYQILKKVWQIVDKAAEQKEQGQVPQQRGGMRPRM